jgi:hypothetical protein
MGACSLVYKSDALKAILYTIFVLVAVLLDYPWLCIGTVIGEILLLFLKEESE